MHTRRALRRVTIERPCPVCGKPDWCLVSDDGTIAICPRTPEGAARDLGDSGFLHVLGASPAAPSFGLRSAAVGLPRRPTRDWRRLADSCRAAIQPPRLAAFARSLSLSVESLERLAVGWSADHHAWTFPMRDGAGAVVGIRLRTPRGRKLAVTGSREGLFYPESLQAGGRLLLAEGPTDAAALLGLGFDAVGRPSCTGGVASCVELARHLRPSEVVVVADADVPGRRGAEAVAGVLLRHVPGVRILTPPGGLKDARAWTAAGADAGDVEAAIANANLRRLGAARRGWEVAR